MSRSRETPFVMSKIKRILSQLIKTTFVMSRAPENYVVITRKQERKKVIMCGRLGLPYNTFSVYQQQYICQARKLSQEENTGQKITNVRRR